MSKHNTPGTRIWVTYKNGVYDITDFVDKHPGQEKILLASGAALEPFWAMYSQHYTSSVMMVSELSLLAVRQHQDIRGVQNWKSCQD